MRRPATHKVLLWLLLFNAASAVGGGLALMTELIPEQSSWVVHTGFPSLYFPGVLLLAVVGGSALLAALALVRGAVGWQLTALVSGVVMIVWIVGEIASIRGFHVLQVVYLVTGAAVLWCVPTNQTRASSDLAA